MVTMVILSGYYGDITSWTVAALNTGILTTLRFRIGAGGMTTSTTPVKHEPILTVHGTEVTSPPAWTVKVN